MGKKSLYLLSIIAVILLVFFLDFKSKNTGVENAYAYDPAFGATYGPGLVNSFETAGTQPFPPYSSRDDIYEWEAKSISGPLPTYIAINGGFLLDGGVPMIGGNGGSMMRITWTGKDLVCTQYIELASDVFENVGCTSPVYQTYEAKDWSCYDYVRLHYYMNGLANGGISTEEAFQRVSLYDGHITFTSNPLNIPVRSPSFNTSMVDHVSISLKFLANYYDQSAGRYFDITNIKNYIIKSVDTNYNNFGNEPLPSEGFPVGSKSVIMYYELLTLTANNITNPPPVTNGISVLMDGSMPRGVELQWTISPSGAGKSPVSAYHVYRATAAEGPYISVGYQSATTSAYADKALPYGDATFCYKILTCDNGPTASIYDERYNTINATYNEALLADAASQCIYVPIIPSPTPTVTPFVSPTITPTFDPNLTPTPVVGDDIKAAHVYPNPFNPNAGTGKFKVDNVPVDTKLQIFSMDGSLVMEGVTSGTAGFSWDGRNKNGSKVVSGLYYLVLKDKKGKSDVKRIIVCYKCDPIDNE